MSFFCTCLIFFSKNKPVSWELDFFEKHWHESVVFLMKNVQNQKYTIISTSFFVTFYDTFRWVNAPNSLRTETRKKTMKNKERPVISQWKIALLIFFLQTIPLWCPFNFCFLKKTGMRASVFDKKYEKSKISWKKSVWERCAFDEKWNQKIKLYYRCLFFWSCCELFL